jgi:hypothetical protein
MKIAIDASATGPPTASPPTASPPTASPPTASPPTARPINDCFICLRHENGQKLPIALCDILQQRPTKPTCPNTSKSAVLPISFDVSDATSRSLVHACNGHVHLDCIREWFETNSSCPMCRSMMVLNTSLLRKKKRTADHTNEVVHIACLLITILCCMIILLVFMILIYFS